MGAMRDFLRGVGILSSAGITVSNAGTRLLNLRNDLNRLASRGAMANSSRNWPALERGRSPSSNPKANEKPIAEERLVGYASAAAKAVASSPKAAKKGGRRKRDERRMPSAALEKKRKYNRERMRRLRASAPRHGLRRGLNRHLRRKEGRRASI